MKLDAFITDNEDNKLYDVIYYHNPKRWQENALPIDSSLLNEGNWSELIKYMNGNDLSEEIKSLPNNKGGIYVFIIQGQTLPFAEYYLAYIGRAQFTDNQNIKKRAKEYFTEYYQKDKRYKINRLFEKWKDFLYYRYYPETDNDIIKQNEAQLIRAILPPFNDEIPKKIDFKQPEMLFRIMDKVNIPAIRGKIGTSTYYITSFTFGQVVNNVKRIDDELHSSTSLRDQIQRSLTDNSHKIKDYILSQSEHFFNSLVLAVYDGEPKWVEMEIDFQNDDFYNLGFLQFNGEEKIFPVDGQHRVEGIKEALKEKPELTDETIGVILIGHSKTPEGMEKSRRIFSTLNRYAKPVRLGDIIALDEDDIVAIVTRELLETYPLFMGSRVKVSNSKSIPHTDKESFTTLMTLYSCHLELLRAFLFQNKGKILTNTQIKEYLRFRPIDDVISNFTEYLKDFWSVFIQTFPEINTYLQNESKNAAAEMRSSVTGGNIFFRPIVLFPFIESITRIKINDNNISFAQIVQHYLNLERIVANEPWNKVIWNPITKKMIMRNQTLTKYIFLYLYDSSLLSDKEKQDMKNKYATILNIEDTSQVINSLSL